MYQVILTRRYLIGRTMPLLAALAVALCTAMVLVVWSVMGGFLNTLLAQGRQMIGDVSIAYPVVGIPHYEELIDELEADPLVDAATPTIESLGLLGLSNGEQRGVTLVGVIPEDYDRVTGFYERLWWKPVGEALPGDDERRDPRLTDDAGPAPDGAFRYDPERLASFEDDGRTLTEADPRTGARRPAMAMGIEVARTNLRAEGGYVVPRFGVFGPDRTYTIATLPLSRRGVAVQLERRKLPVANEFRSGMFDVDANWIILPLGELQEMLKLNRAELLDPDWHWSDGTPPEVIGEYPARVTHILVRAAEGVAPAELEARAEEIYEAFAKRYPGLAPLDDEGAWRELIVYTWEEKPGLKTFIAAVRKETALVLVLFAFISLTAVFLVAAIFWSMVSEKTRDVGILRAIGASRAGVAWLFLRYGLAIGAVGSLAGGALSWLIVTNINPIHSWMGRALGLTVWDPSVYYFTEIPSRVEPQKAAIVLCAGVLASALGALLPALAAARMDPVRALRFE